MEDIKTKQKPKVCGNCKHGGEHFKIKNLGTHLHCEHPKEEVRGEDGWGTLREWYNKYSCFELKV